MYKKNKYQKGFAIVFTLGFASVVLLLLAISTKYVIDSLNRSSKEFMKSGQSVNIAKAGAEQAYFWFMRQQVDAVNRFEMDNIYKKLYGTTTSQITYSDAAFFPRHKSDINFSDTDNESIGLVKDILIDSTSNLYGRYIVKRQNVSNEIELGLPIVDSITNTLIYNVSFDPSKDIKDAVHDISHLRGNKIRSSGSTWRVTSTGYLYIRNDFEKDADGVFKKNHDEKPNLLLDQAKVSIDIQRLKLSNDLVGAILINDGSKVNINDSLKDKILGGSKIGVYSKINLCTKSGVSGTPSSQVFVPPSYNLSATLDLSPESIFGISESELKGISDQNEKSVQDLEYNNKSLGSMTLTYIDGNATFTQSKPLKGGGILFVNGDLNISQDSNSLFSGLIYVKGNLFIGGTNTISGCIVMGGTSSTVSLNASTDISQVEYSESILSSVKQRMAKYKMNNLSYKIITGNK